MLAPEFSHPTIAHEFKRWVATLSDEPCVEEESANLITTYDVLRAHFLLQDFFYDTRTGDGIGGIGPRDMNLLHSAVSRQTVSFGRKRKWTKDIDICATLFFGLIKNHPFHDCNKRTALLTVLYHLERIGKRPDAPQDDFQELAVRVAESKLEKYNHFDRFRKSDDKEVLFISYFLRRNTRDIDTKYYTITFRQLESILNGFNFTFGEPHDNRIAIQKEVEESKYLGLHKRKVKKTVATIGFPNWNEQVSRRDIKVVRDATGLTPENGYDSEVFYKGRDPMWTFIRTFERPLRRLANR